MNEKMVKGKILVVDDQEIVLKACSLLFSCIGFKVASSFSGKGAVSIAQTEEFDIAYVDLLMPEMNGVETCRRIKDSSPQTEVFLMSGGGPDQLDQHRAAFIKAGGRDVFINKPFDTQKLVDLTYTTMAEKSQKEITSQRQIFAREENNHVVRKNCCG